MSAFRRTRGPDASAGISAPPAARHARGGSTGLGGNRGIRDRHVWLLAIAVPCLRLDASGRGDRVGRLRETPAAASGPATATPLAAW